MAVRDGTRLRAPNCVLPRPTTGTFETRIECVWRRSFKERAARERGRPLSTRETNHLVLRSTQAKGALSFRHAKNEAHVRRILKKFAIKYGVQILSFGNAGNHLHLQMKLSCRHTYKAFIRAVTGSIAMAITERSRWSEGTRSRETHEEPHGAKSSRETKKRARRLRFWDRRPFTRIVQSFKAYKHLKSYIRINHLEGDGYSRQEARDMVEIEQRLMRETG